MRLLTIDDAAKAKVQRVLDYAKQPEHWYIVETGGGSKQKPPGDNENHVVQLDTYRCVFSFSKEMRTDKLYRHLSISIPDTTNYPHEKYPNPMAAYTIAEMFGFTLPRDSWVIDVNRLERCVVLLQEAASTL
jgi:hypothetical protein